ncbi:PhoU domain-containing protein [Methylomonas sp. MO1]|uniref:phosphate signaling complex PhoU family protein n=1 Tax=Methylomonas sp. MO1 TaxID=3073619 RepID=UPI0028A4469F|nr:PhoU domain-containing protein [Methylomonas sp. MO1]MDT4287967.1 PhoU domain-containing protein [Methylomonas sp. MO1]
MTPENNLLAMPHILKHVDVELDRLHHSSVDMLSLILVQWELVMEAMDEANLESALEVIALNKEIRARENQIHQAIMHLLAQENPVARDLRVVLSISKISGTLLYLTNETRKIGKLILALYEPRSGVPNAQLVRDIVKISDDIRIALEHLVYVLNNLDANNAHRLLKSNIDGENATWEAVRHQLGFINQDPRQVGPGLTVLQILNALESCRDHCKNLAEYCIFMIDGQDVRHTNRLKSRSWGGISDKAYMGSPLSN